MKRDHFIVSCYVVSLVICVVGMMSVYFGIEWLNIACLIAVSVSGCALFAAILMDLMWSR